MAKAICARAGFVEVGPADGDGGILACIDLPTAYPDGSPLDTSTLEVYGVAMSKQTSVPDFLSRDYWSGTIKMSLSKFFILCVLHERPMHGYEIAAAVENTTDGGCCPREGTVYPVLKQFAEGGYVSCEKKIVSGRERKIYTITDKGREAFRVGLQEWMGMTECLRNCRFIADAPGC